jgi:amino acid transporter
LSDEAKPTKDAPLERGLGLWQAVALNVSNMVGIGPFITIPLFISAMGGPQALIGWVVAAVLVICDGLVWSELGAALPGSGGTYHFLRETFGKYRWGRILPFLFVWQFLVSGALEMASGYIGALQYLEYIFPALRTSVDKLPAPTNPLIHQLQFVFPTIQTYGGARWIAFAAAVAVTLILCQRITFLGKLGIVLAAGALVTVLTVIVFGLLNFDAALLTMPKDAFQLNWKFSAGLGGAMLIAIYDYLGYYNVCHLGDEVKEPERTIPRAILISVLLIAALYLTMNISILGVIPWQEAMKSTNIAADFMERLHGRSAGVAMSIMILWTAIACMFAITLGYSRIPYAAALAGDFFKVFAYVHPTRKFPVVSLLSIGALTAVFCFLSLQTVIDAAVCVRIVIQFIGQIAALHLLHKQRGASNLPFRMWLYPIPSLIALAGWVFVLASGSSVALWLSLGVVGSGIMVFVLREAMKPAASS